MKHSRLFHAVVVMGTSITASGAVAAIVATMTGCAPDKAWPTVDAAVDLSAPSDLSGHWVIVDLYVQPSDLTRPPDLAVGDGGVDGGRDIHLDGGDDGGRG